MCSQHRISSPVLIWWCSLALLAACSAFLGSAPTEGKATEPEPASECECECSAELEAVELELAQCQERPVLDPVQKTRVLTRSVEVRTPAKRCASKGPDIKPVKSTTCAPGMLCLDERNQANLLSNELAYRSWIADVRECERDQ
jgi:hypothetical protein